MDSSPIYIVVGSILGIISAMVLLILHFQEVAKVVWGFLKRIYEWLRTRPLRLNEWRWWRQNRIIYEVVNHGELHVIWSKLGWRLELPLSIRYTNQNKRYEAGFNGSDYGVNPDILVTIKHNGKGWESRPIRLLTGIGGYQKLLPSEVKEIKYTFYRDLPAKPLWGPSVDFKVVNKLHGNIDTWDVISVGGLIKRQGKNKFVTSVVWDTKNEATKEN